MSDACSGGKRVQKKKQSSKKKKTFAHEISHENVNTAHIVFGRNCHGDGRRSAIFGAVVLNHYSSDRHQGATEHFQINWRVDLEVILGL